MKPLRFIWIFITFTSLPMAGFGLSASAASLPLKLLDRILVIVNDDVITESEFKRELQTVVAGMRSRNIKLPSEVVLNRQVLDRMVTDLVQLQTAELLDIEVNEAQIRQAIESIAQRNNMTVAQMEQALAEEGQTMNQYRDSLRKQLKIKQLLDREISSQIEVTPEEIEQFLATQEKVGGLDAEYEVAHILVSVSESSATGEVETARNQAEEAIAKLAGGVAFPEVAAVYSNAQDALEGGYLGWRKAGELPSLFLDELKLMKKGEVSDILRSPNGLHIIKLINRKGGEKEILIQTRASHILIRPSDLESDERIQERLRQIKQRVEGGGSFADFAISYSEDQLTRLNGGDLGWLNPGDMVAAIEQVMRKLRPGEISDPVQSPYGYHLLQVTDRRETDKTEEIDRNNARQQIYARKADERFEFWIRSLRESAFIEYRLEQL